MNHKLRTGSLVLGLSMGFVALTGCGQQSGQTGSLAGLGTATGAVHSTPVTSEAPPGEILEQLVASAPDVPEELATHLWSNVQWDGRTLKMPEELASLPQVQLIVAGTIQSVESGPILFATAADDPQAEQQVVLGVRVALTIKGETPRSDMVYVQLDGNWPLKRYHEGLPSGAVVGLYLEAPPQVGEEFPVGDPQAGRPEGEPLWQTGPQGFVLADGPNGGIILPYDSRQDKETTFVSQFPEA